MFILDLTSGLPDASSILNRPVTLPFIDTDDKAGDKKDDLFGFLKAPLKKDTVNKTKLLSKKQAEFLRNLRELEKGGKLEGIGSDKDKRNAFFKNFRAAFPDLFGENPKVNGNPLKVETDPRKLPGIFALEDDGELNDAQKKAIQDFANPNKSSGFPVLDGLLSAARATFAISSNALFNLGNRAQCQAICKLGISMTQKLIEQVTESEGDTTALQGIQFVFSTLHGIAEQSMEFWTKAAKDQFVTAISQFNDLSRGSSA